MHTCKLRVHWSGPKSHHRQSPTHHSTWPPLSLRHYWDRQPVGPVVLTAEYLRLGVWEREKEEGMWEREGSSSFVTQRSNTIWSSHSTTWIIQTISLPAYSNYSNWLSFHVRTTWHDNGLMWVLRDYLGDTSITVCLRSLCRLKNHFNFLNIRPISEFQRQTG